jgi:type IV secretion system protein VirB10
VSLFRPGPTDPPASQPAGGAGEPPPDEGGRPGSSAEVPGERGIPSVNRVRSVQSRVSTVLTLTLMFGLAGGLLVWYYSGAINRSARATQLAEAAAKRRAQGDTSLPSLGVITPPKSPFPEHSPLESVLGPAPPIPVNAPEIPIATANPYPPGPPKKTPEELEMERRLGGPVLAASSNDRPAQTTSTQYADGGSAEAAGAGPIPGTTSPSNSEGGEGNAAAPPTLAALLKPTSTPAVRAQVLPTRRFMLPKGAFVDCTLETAINSALPGMTTCVTATDTFSADGNVVLLERGTKLVGETRGDIQQGEPRLFVLWTEARTPTGVVVPLASPGTDELGRSGLPGVIDRHWLQRFGDAILITVIDGVVQGLSQNRGSNSTVVVNPSTTSEVGTEILRDSLHIRATIRKAQGDRIQIFVARDVDFRSVYALHATPGDP